MANETFLPGVKKHIRAHKGEIKEKEATRVGDVNLS